MDDEKRKWLKRVLGKTDVGATPTADATLKKAVSFAKPSARRPPVRPSPLGTNRTAALRRPVALSPKLAKPVKIDGPGDRKLEIRKGADGKVAFTAPNPTLGEITFSGGGGKGVALAGAVYALQEQLPHVTVVKGASVGSMTAALVAAGITADDFKTASDDPRTSERVLEGRIGGKSAAAHGILGYKISGTGLKGVVREQMSKAAAKRIDALLKGIEDSAEQGESSESESDSDSDDGGPKATKKTGDGGIDQALLKEIAGIRDKIKDPNSGLTFGDLRKLHRVIPEIKEVEIVATMIGSDVDGDGNKGKPQLVVFNADTQPDVEVALASQASAALPPVFAPVEIKLSQGITGRFIDGGVLNNAPSAKTVRAQRDLDPIPQSSGMTFIFEEDTGEEQDIFKGAPMPGKFGATDKIAGAEHTAGEYARARALADSPEDVVVVPLKFKVKGAFGREKEKNFASLTGGTVNFEISAKSKKVLQDMTQTATEGHIAKRKQPLTREFASEKQMLNCVGRDDLAALVAQRYPGAKEELEFRDAAVTAIRILVGLLSQDDSPTKAPNIDAQLLELEKLAAGEEDRAGFVAREMARTGRLDELAKRGATSKGKKLSVLEASGAVVESIEAQDHARTVLREVIYPQMVRIDMKKPRGITLKQVDDALRGAQSRDDVNDALDRAVNAYMKPKKIREKYADFIAECGRYKM